MHDLTNNQTGNLIYLIGLICLIGGGILRSRRMKLSLVFKQLLCWLVIILTIVLLYSYRYEFSSIKDRIQSELMPSKVVRISDHQISINVSEGGHFFIDLKINDETVHFMVDTGASDIVLNQSDAKRVGIAMNNLNYSKMYETANGQVFGASVKLEKIELGGIIFHDIYASVNNADLETSLLGMSFLKHFKKYEFYQDKLILTY